MAEVVLDAAIVTERLRQMARLLKERGFVRKGVDMSSSAVTIRLQTLSALTDACQRLARLGPRLSHPSSRGC